MIDPVEYTLKKCGGFCSGDKWHEEAVNHYRTVLAAKEKAESELAKTKRILEIERNSRHEFCPDCRDKVKGQPCFRCQLQKAEADLLRVRKERMAASPCPARNATDGLM